MRFDQRVPVVFAPAAAQAGDAVLVEGEAGVAGAAVAACFLAEPLHATGCRCCAGRSAAAVALTALLHRRARGDVAFFQRVVVDCSTDAGRSAVAQALTSDPLVSACYRVAG